MPENGEIVRLRDKVTGTEFSTPWPVGGIDSERYAQTGKTAVDSYGNALPAKFNPLKTPSANTTNEPDAAPTAKEAQK